jgi:uncharacterized protein with FMN-binding domain
MGREESEAMTMTAKKILIFDRRVLYAFAGLVLMTSGPAASGADAAKSDSTTAASGRPSVGTTDVKAASVLRDGRYEAESPEWTGMRVAVQIRDGRLASVEVLKAKGTPRFYERVLRRLPDRIAERGSPEVDGITGATLSSNSLKTAVRSAMKKAEADVSR